MNLVPKRVVLLLLLTRVITGFKAAKDGIRARREAIQRVPPAVDIRPHRSEAASAAALDFDLSYISVGITWLEELPLVLAMECEENST